MFFGVSGRFVVVRDSPYAPICRGMRKFLCPLSLRLASLSYINSLHLVWVISQSRIVFVGFFVRVVEQCDCASLVRLF
jgi:hypothetical protein